MCAKRHYNIATVDWLQRVLSSPIDSSSTAADPLPFTPADMICTTAELSTEFLKHFDRYGDSYTSHVTNLTSVSVLLSAIDVNNLSDNCPALSRTDMYALESELCAPAKPNNFYRLATAFFATDSSNLRQAMRMRHAELLFRWYGGRILSARELRADKETVQRLSHVFVDDRNMMAGGINAFRLKHTWCIDGLQEKGVKFVSIRWVLSCHRLGNKIRVGEFVMDMQ